MNLWQTSATQPLTWDEAVRRIQDVAGPRAPIMAAIADIETSRGRDLSNPRSSAKGYFHFLDENRRWAASRGVPYGNDIESQTRAMMAKDDSDAAIFRARAGRDPLPHERYLLHYQGGPVGTALLTAPRDTPLWAALGPRATQIYAANPNLAKYRTTGDMIADYQRMFERRVAQYGAPAPTKAEDAGMSDAMPIQTTTPAQMQTAPAAGVGMNMLVQQNVAAQRSKALSDLLNGIALQKDGPRTPLEGISRMVAGITGAYHGSQADKGTISEREAMIGLLANEDPLVQVAVATGNPDVLKTVIAKKLEATYRKPTEKETQVQELMRLGMPEAQARALAYGGVKMGTDGSQANYLNGVMTSAQGGQFNIPGFGPGVTPAPGANSAASAPGANSAAGTLPAAPVSGGAQSGIRPTKETTNAAQKKMMDMATQDQSFNAIIDLIDPEFLTTTGAWKMFAEELINRATGKEAGLIDPYKASAFQSAVGMAFNEYRRYVTGAAAAQKELEQLQKDFINPGDSLPKFLAKAETLKALNKRNYQIYSDLIKQGFDPNLDPVSYGKAFDKALASGNYAVDMSNVPAAARERAETIMRRAQEKKDAAKREKTSATAQPAEAQPSNAAATQAPAAQAQPATAPVSPGGAKPPPPGWDALPQEMRRALLSGASIRSPDGHIYTMDDWAPQVPRDK